MTRARIRFDDLERQRAWLAEALASPFAVATRPPVLVKRPKPPEPEVGPTLLDLLDAMPPRVVDAPRVEKSRKRTPAQVIGEAGMLSMRKPNGPDREEVGAAIMDMLPRGVPTYVKEIVAVNISRGRDEIRMIADLMVFDGAVARVEITGRRGCRGCRWHSSGVEGTAFHWDGDAGRWERVPDLH